MIETQMHDGIVEVRLARPPVNALSPELFAALSAALEKAAADGARGIVLSGRPGMFSAGLDVPTLLGQDEAGMRDTWRRFFGVTRWLAESHVPVAAAITGHSPAGGCVLTMFCDYRVMAAGDYKIGLNEVQVGLFPGPVIYRAYERLIGPRRAELYLSTGAMLDAQQALAAGLVDELVPLEQVVPAAIDWLRRSAALPPEARRQTREMTRAGLRDIVAGLGPEAFDLMTRAWFSPETQSTLRALVEKLRKPK